MFSVFFNLLLVLSIPFLMVGIYVFFNKRKFKKDFKRKIEPADFKRMKPSYSRHPSTNFKSKFNKEYTNQKK